MEYLLLGVITAFNFIVLKYKFEKKRYSDLAIDVSVLLFLSWLFKGTITGLIVAMIAGTIISLFLLTEKNKKASNA